MKCARCDHDSTYPQRTARICPGCKKQFAFEPRAGDPLSDMAWKSAIDWCSSGGTVRFTRSNLHHAIARRMAAKRAPVGSVLLIVAAIVLFIVAISKAVLGVAILAGGALLLGIWGLEAHKRRGLTLERGEFDRMLRQWIDAHGSPAKLIAPVVTTAPPARAVAEELEHYSFDRAVVCDVPDTVDLLLGNDFHFENNCAVITADGYPGHAFATVRKMLSQNPRLEVFVLHDATVEGCVLARHLRTSSDWFAGSAVRVYDVALRPAQAAKQPKLLWHDARHVGQDPALTDDERAWLARHSMSVAALSPEQTIKRLFRAINRMPELAALGGATSSTDDTVILWTTDAHASDGGGDSFG
jgi:hypothetical protein